MKSSCVKKKPSAVASRVAPPGTGRLWISFGLVLSATICLAAAAGATQGCLNPWPLDRAFVMYTYGPLPTALLDKIADRFEFGIEGYRPDVKYLHERNSKFKYTAIYNSLSDNYVAGLSQNLVEHNWLAANAANYGLTIEDAYLHFREDTVVSLQGQQIAIPGWNPNWQAGDPPASATSEDQARVPVYFADLSRRATHFSFQAVRDLHRDYMIHTLNQPLIDQIYPGGIFFDNAAYYHPNVDVVSGGSVLEHPQHEVINSNPFNDWWFLGGMKLLVTELRAYLDANPQLIGNRPVKLIPNTANVPHITLEDRWRDGYVSPPYPDILFMEFEYNPTRDTGEDMPERIYSLHGEAMAAGVSIFETGMKIKTVSGVPGSFTDDEAMMNTLAGHWVHRVQHPSAKVYILGNEIWQIGWSQTEWERNIAPAFEVDLGAPLGPPFILKQGTDGNGNSYRVYGRRLACGLAIVRHRAPWNGAFDASSSVSVDLGAAYLPLGMDGQLQSATSSWTLRNGEGQVFLSQIIFEDGFDSGNLSGWSIP